MNKSRLAPGMTASRLDAGATASRLDAGVHESRLDAATVAALCAARHGDPFAVLGIHAEPAGGWWLRTLKPGALHVEVLDRQSRKVLGELKEWRDRAAAPTAAAATAAGHAAPPAGEASVARSAADAGSGLFEARLPGPATRFAYLLRVFWPGAVVELEDPYRFPPVLGEMDLWLLAEGTHRRPFERLGAHLRELEGVAGTSFAVWAPAAARVSVVGDFNHWDGRVHPMRLRRECGVWEIFLPGVGEGARYKYEILATDGRLLPLKADPYGFAAELRPSTASVVAVLPPLVDAAARQPAGETLGRPVAIYEVHLPSWRPSAAGGFPDWAELAATLIPYAASLGFTHLELLPVSEYPFDASWGYQPLGLYAPSARFGPPEGLRNFVAAAHAAGLQVIVDWVPAHFPDDAHGLGEFDGTALYEHADPREGRHKDWGTLIYNYGRREVVNFLIGNALYWVERYGIDGLRVDAVASMLYRDYSRRPGEWTPNIHGGRENLEAMDFLRRLNSVLGEAAPQTATYAEESTAWPQVTRPPWVGGLGFHYKWNLGWMHDVLGYFGQDPVHRKYHHHQLTFGLLYAFSENFVLPLSHDEVVHGKGSLFGKMAGDRWQKFANLRALYGFMWSHPGKKLLFMGGEIAQQREWNHASSLDWGLLDDPAHAGVQQLVRDLNTLYRTHPALHELDTDPAGFEWIAADDAEVSVYAFVRRARSSSALTLTVCNLTPVPRSKYRVGVPAAGEYRECINTDSRFYGGSDVGNPFGRVTADNVPAHGRDWSVALTLPPLACLIFEWIP